MVNPVIQHGGLVGIAAVCWFITTQATTPTANQFFNDVFVPLFDGIVQVEKIPFFMVFVSFVLTVLSKVPVYFAQSGEGKGYNNKAPREQQAKLKGWGQRALYAHMNTFEAFPAFCVAVILAHLGQVPLQVQINLTLFWLVNRILYTIFYIVNIDVLRSLVWFNATYAAGRLLYLAAVSK